LKGDSLDRQAGGWAASLAQSDPLPAGSSARFDSVAQKRDSRSVLNGYVPAAMTSTA